MQVYVQVTLAKGDKPVDADQAAAKVLAALDGDPESDSCSVTVMLPATTGAAGQGGVVVGV